MMYLYIHTYIHTYIYICRSCSNIVMVWRAAGAAQCDTCRWTYAGPVFTRDDFKRSQCV